jgi:hypothetical protein
MRKYILPFASLVLLSVMSACQDEASYMPQIEQMKDSIFNAYPTVGAITIKVEDKTNLKVVLGDERLYGAAAEARQKEANELGLMAIRIFGKDSHLRAGALIVTKDMKNNSEKPADGIVTPINIDSLK